MPNLALHADQLRHTYASTVALDGLNLEVPEGALFGLLGPNGSGKTTFFRIVCTLLKPDGGTCTLHGHDVIRQPANARRTLGVVFQSPALDESLTIEENLRLHGALYGMRGAALHEAVHLRMRQLGLTDRAHMRCNQLSGGLLRRTDLARGVLHRPKVLLLDEPTNGLDPIARREFWEMLHQLRQEEGLTIIVATHLMEEAEKCDRIAILHKGICRAQGTPDALRDEVGRQTLWLETPDAETLATAVQTSIGVEAHAVNGRVQIRHEAPQSFLAALYGQLGDQITSATIRKPTLEDVFVLNTGARYENDPV